MLDRHAGGGAGKRLSSVGDGWPTLMGGRNDTFTTSGAVPVLLDGGAGVDTWTAYAVGDERDLRHRVCIGTSSFSA